MFRWGDDEHGRNTQGANGVMRRVRIYQDMANTLEELDKLTISAVNGLWGVSDADRKSGVRDFTSKGELWKMRRSMSKNFWVD